MFYLRIDSFRIFFNHFNVNIGGEMYLNLISFRFIDKDEEEKEMQKSHYIK